MLPATSGKEMWPVMLTPFTPSGEVDYNALSRLIDWYEENGASGLFAVCQSSEVFYLSLEERLKITTFVKRRAHIPVIASGHVSYAIEAQIDELRRIADIGVDATILITNRLAEEYAQPEVWMENLQQILNAMDPAMPIGFYECPYPYKRLISLDELRQLAGNSRFRFLKDTCCDLDLIKQRLRILKGSALGLYNANTTTLLESLQDGAAGFSGVMCNFHPDLYAWLLKNYQTEPDKAQMLQSMLTLCSLIEAHLYPVNAKYALQLLGLPVETYARAKNHHLLTPVLKDEVEQMARVADFVRQRLIAG